MHAAVAGGHSDDGDSGRERAHRLAEGARIDGRDGHGVPSLSGPGRGYGGEHHAATGSRRAPAGAVASAWADVSVRISSRRSDRISRTSRQIGISRLAAP